MSDDVLHLKILTPTKQLFDSEVAAFQVATTRGLVDVLPGHAEMVSVLDIGTAHVTFPGDLGYGLALHGGIMRIHPGPRGQAGQALEPDTVVVLASEAEHPEAIDLERAKAALERATEALGDAADPAERAQVTRDQLRAEARIAAFKSFQSYRDEAN